MNSFSKITLLESINGLAPAMMKDVFKVKENSSNVQKECKLKKGSVYSTMYGIEVAMLLKSFVLSRT